jgi:hypothetical protein
LIVGDGSLNWVYHLERWFARCFRRVWVGSVAAIFFLGKPWRLFGYLFVARPLPLPPGWSFVAGYLGLAPKKPPRCWGLLSTLQAEGRGQGALGP